MNSTRKVIIFPSNRPNSQSAYSAKDGAPQINFQIGNQPAWLDAQSLTLNFTLEILDTAGNPPNNDDQRGTGVAGDVRTNALMGGMACIDSIDITNANNNSLEFVRALPRLAATLIPYRSNFDDYANDIQYSFGATSNTEAQGMFDNSPRQISAPLLASMFLGQDLIPLGDRGVGGLNITLNIAASIEALFGLQGAGAYYKITNPTLRATMVHPPQGQLPPIENYSYLAYSNYYSTISNSDVTQNINCNLSSVLSTFTNFVPTSWIASSLNDGNATYELLDPSVGIASQVPISRFTLLRSAIQYPYRFQLTEANNITQTGAGAAGGYQVVYEAQLQRNAYTGVAVGMKNLSNTLVGNTSQGTQAISTVVAPLDQHFNSIGLKAFAIGGRYDGLSIGEGASFIGRPFSQRIESKYTPLTGLPNSSFTFMLSKHMLSFDDRGSSSLAN